MHLCVHSAPSEPILIWIFIWTSQNGNPICNFFHYRIWYIYTYSRYNIQGCGHCSPCSKCWHFYTVHTTQNIFCLVTKEQFHKPFKRRRLIEIDMMNASVMMPDKITVMNPVIESMQSWFCPRTIHAMSSLQTDFPWTYWPWRSIHIPLLNNGVIIIRALNWPVLLNYFL